MESMATMVILLTIVLLVIAFWFLVKCFELLVRVWKYHHDKRALQVSGMIALIGLALAGLLSLVAPAFAGNDQTIFAIAGILLVVALVQHLVVAKVVDVWYNDLFLVERDRDLLIHDVLKSPWFQPNYLSCCSNACSNAVVRMTGAQDEYMARASRPLHELVASARGARCSARNHHHHHPILPVPHARRQESLS
jgi:hypothetical protein